MRIIKPSVESISPEKGGGIFKHIERYGRVCYKSNAAHPQMREVALIPLKQMRRTVPVVFDDIKEE